MDAGMRTAEDRSAEDVFTGGRCFGGETTTVTGAFHRVSLKMRKTPPGGFAHLRECPPITMATGMRTAEARRAEEGPPQRSLWPFSAASTMAAELARTLQA
jgi:hypothetical protein